MDTDLSATQIVAFGVALGGIAPPVAPVGSTTPPAGTDPNVYPLMPDTGATGDITLGVAIAGVTKAFAFRVSNPPQATVKSQFNIAMNINTPGAKLLAQNIVVTSNAGEGQGQLITINGIFGDAPILYLIGSGSGLQDCFISGMTYGGLPYYDFSLDNSRSSVADFDGVSIYNSSHAQTLVIGPWQTPAVPVAPVAVDTAMGASLTPSGGVASPVSGILSALAAMLLAGSILSIPAGAYVGTTTVGVVSTIDGAGMGKTIFNLTGHALSQNKSAFLSLVGGATYSNMSVTGCVLADALGANGAAFRDESNNEGFNLLNIEAYGNDNGILTFGSDINLTGCNFHGNGSTEPSGIGHTHNKYVGGNGSVITNPDGTVTITPSTNHLTMKSCIGSAANGGHDTKSRAGYTNILNDNSTTGGNGRNLDVPDGGVVSVSGGTWTIPAGSANLVWFGHSTESKNNAATGKSITFTNHAFVNLTGQPGYMVFGDSTVIVNFVGCTWPQGMAVFQGAPTIIMDGVPYVIPA
jgi:hypothetical protein